MNIYHHKFSGQFGGNSTIVKSQILLMITCGRKPSSEVWCCIFWFRRFIGCIFMRSHQSVYRFARYIPLFGMTVMVRFPSHERTFAVKNAGKITITYAWGTKTRGCHDDQKQPGFIRSYCSILHLCRFFSMGTVYESRNNAFYHNCHYRLYCRDVLGMEKYQREGWRLW